MLRTRVLGVSSVSERSFRQNLMITRIDSKRSNLVVQLLVDDSETQFDNDSERAFSMLIQKVEAEVHPYN